MSNSCLAVKWFGERADSTQEELGCPRMSEPLKMGRVPCN